MKIPRDSALFLPGLLEQAEKDKGQGKEPKGKEMKNIAEDRQEMDLEEEKNEDSAFEALLEQHDELVEKNKQEEQQVKQQG